jgi:hypothetical protein
MQSYEALQKAIAGHTADHAKRLGLSTILLNKWQEPHVDYTDSGAYNPLDRIEAIIEKSLELGIPPDDAFAPIYFLSQQFNLITIHIPEEIKEGQKEIYMELSKCIKEFSDMTGEVSKALEDGRIDKLEYKRIEKETWELVQQAISFLYKAQESVK